VFVFRVKSGSTPNDYFHGEFEEDQKNGYGILYYANGDRLEAKWENDKKNGKGILYRNDSTLEKYEWRNNIKIN